MLNKTDIKVLMEFINLKVEGESPSSWDMMKKIFKEKHKREIKRSEENRENSSINRSMKRLNKLKILNLKKTKYNIGNKIIIRGIYSLEEGKAFIKKIKFDNEEKRAIIFNTNEKWVAIEI